MKMRFKTLSILAGTTAALLLAANVATAVR